MKKPSNVVTSDRVIFSNLKAPFRQILEVPEYHFHDILPGDRVIDIGANVGAFCIRAARLTSYVTAVEPRCAAGFLKRISVKIRSLYI